MVSKVVSGALQALCSRYTNHVRQLSMHGTPMCTHVRELAAKAGVA